MRKPLLFFIILLLSQASFAQTFRWMQELSVQYETLRAIATDKHGNGYITGHFYNSVTFGSYTLNSDGEADVFICKYDSAGNVLWAINEGGSLLDMGQAIEVDSGGNIYVTGTYTGSAQFGNKTLSGGTDQCCFLAKYNPSGTLIWVAKSGSGATGTGAQGRALDIDKDGNIFLTGIFKGNVPFGGTTSYTIYINHPNNSNYDLYVARYDKNGVLKWARGATGDYFDIPVDIKSDNSGNVYVGGYFNGDTLKIDSVALYAHTWHNAGFILKFNYAGYCEWGMHHPFTDANGQGLVHGLSIPGDGYIYACGAFAGQSTFNNLSLYAPYYAWQAYVAKIKSSGTVVWVRAIEPDTNSQSICRDIVADAAGNTYSTGSILYNLASSAHNICGTNYPTNGGESFTTRLDSSGACSWTIRGAATGPTSGYGICLDPVGGLHFMGDQKAGLRMYMPNDTAAKGYLPNQGHHHGRFILKEFILVKNPSRVKFCPGDSLYVSYNKYGSYSSSGTFSVQLSDGKGSFANPQTIGSKGTTGPDSMKVYLPANLPSGTGYRIRVQASSPLVRSNENSFDLEISVPKAIAGNDTTLCNGDSTILRGSLSSATTYLWRSDYSLADSTSADVKVIPQGSRTYILRTTNISGCVNFDTVKVNIKSRPLADSGRDTLVCPGDSIRLNAGGGISYLWSPGTGMSDSTIADPKVMIQAKTTYRVTVSNGVCAETDSIVLDLPKPLALQSISDDTICRGEVISLEAIASGGRYWTYDYAWSHGLADTSVQLVDPDTTTTYSLILTDGCTSGAGAADTIQVTVNVRPQLHVIPRSDTLVCISQSINLFASGNGGDSQNYTFTWDNGAGQGSPMIIADSTITFRVILSDNCTLDPDTGYVVITTRSPLQLNTSADTVICTGQSTLIGGNPTGGYANYSYIWDQGLGTGSSHNVSPVQNTTYRVILSDNCSPADTGYVRVNVNPPLKVQARSDTTICKGQSVMLFAAGTGGKAGALSFEWDHGLGISQNVIATPDSSTTYSVVLSDNCTVLPDTGYVNITVRAPLSVIAREDTIICNGQSVDIFADASGGDSLNYSFNWDQTLGNGDRFGVQPTVTTKYMVIVTDNCSSDPDTAYTTVKVRLPLLVTFTPDTIICLGQGVDLYAEGSGGDSLAYSFTWNNSLGQGNSRAVSPDTTTVYEIVLTDNCTLNSDSALTEVKVRPSLKVNAGPDTTICYGETITLNAAANGGFVPGYSLIWDTGDSTYAISVKPIITQTYKVVISDNCTVENDTDEVIVTVRDPLTVTASPSFRKICSGDSVRFVATGTGGFVPGYTWSWSNGAGSVKDPLLFPATSGSYVIMFSDGCSVAASDTADIEVEQLPVVNFKADDTTGCAPFETLLQDQSLFLPGSIHTWTDGNGNSFTGPAPTLKYNKSGIYSPSLHIVSPFGCRDSTRKNAYIIVHPTPVADFIAEPERAMISDPEITFVNRSNGAEKYIWDFGDGNSDITDDVYDEVKHLYSDTGYLTVTLLAETMHGCSAITMRTVYIEEDYRLYFPDAFTPNGDGLNDVFSPTSNSADVYELTIYDRWGGILYFSAEGIAWNGKSRNGDPVATGVYAYTFASKDRHGRSHFVHGAVTVLR